MLQSWPQLQKDFELILIGVVDDSFRDVFQDGIRIIPPLLQSDLHAGLANYDIGMAMDLTGRDSNRDIALTNKILAYYQAGLYIMATNTAAQKDFMNRHPGHGIVFKQDDRALFLSAILAIKNDIIRIRAGSLKRYQDAYADNWENESGKLVHMWKESLH